MTDPENPARTFRIGERAQMVEPKSATRLDGGTTVVPVGSIVRVIGYKDGRYTVYYGAGWVAGVTEAHLTRMEGR